MATACRSAIAAGQHGLRMAPVSLSRLRDGATAFSPYAGIGDPLRAVIRDSVAWRELWTRINRPFVPAPALPTIDFAREMIVVAALGSRPNAGYDVVIESAEQDSAGIQISVRVGVAGGRVSRRDRDDAADRSGSRSDQLINPFAFASAT